MTRVGLAAAVLAVGTADAATVTALYEGTVSGSDLTGIMDDGGDTTFEGSFVATLVYDTALGNRVTGGSGGSDTLTGGTAFGASNPIISALLEITTTVGTTVLSFTGAQATQISVSEGSFGLELVDFDVVDADGERRRLIRFDGFDDAFVPDLEAEYDGTPTSLGRPEGQFFIAEFDSTLGDFTTNTFGGFDVERLRITVEDGPVDPPPIPLPASALLLVGALGGLGLVQRRRVG